MGIAETVAALREGRMSVEMLTRKYLACIFRLDGARGLNAVSQLNADARKDARAMDARGAREEETLFGLPVLVKDNIDVRGLATTAGSAALKGNIAKEDAPAIARLRARGALILGKTNMTEFANYTGQGMPGGYSSLGGQVKSAYGKNVEPSGSSTGSAVAVSAGLCAAALGTDTSFSVVGCATQNGVTGLKPPVGTLSCEGVVPIAHTLDSIGFLTHTLSDALYLYDALREEPMGEILPISPSALKIAVNAHNRDMVSDAQLQKYARLFAKLRAGGAEITEIVQPHTPFQRDVMRCEFGRDLNLYLQKAGARPGSLREIVEFYRADPERMMKYGISYLEGALSSMDSPADADIYRNALAQRARLRAETLAQLAPYDACVMTGPTNIMHFTGLASLALNLGMSDRGAPRGIILYGTDERRLYAAALTLEHNCERVTPPRHMLIKRANTRKYRNARL